MGTCKLNRSVRDHSFVCLHEIHGRQLHQVNFRLFLGNLCPVYSVDFTCDRKRTRDIATLSEPKAN